jgi:hypothetical protein
MDYEQTLLFFTVIKIIGVILYKSKYFVNEPDGQLGTVRPQASFSFFSKAFYSEVVPPPLD